MTGSVTHASGMARQADGLLDLLLSEKGFRSDLDTVDVSEKVQQSFTKTSSL